MDIYPLYIRNIERLYHLWVKNYTIAHVKLREPINIGCMIYVKELQEMAIRNHANRECS